MRIVVSLNLPRRLGAEACSDAAAGQQFAEAAAQLARDHDLVIHHERMARTAGSATRDTDSEDTSPEATTRSQDLIVLEQELRNALPATKPVVVVLAMIEAAAVNRTPPPAKKIRRLDPRRHHRPEASPPVELMAEHVRMLPRAILDTRPAEWLLAHDCLVVCGCPAIVSYDPATRRLAAADVTVDATDASVVLAEDLAADLLVVVSTELITPGSGIPRQRRAVLHPDHLDAQSLPEPLRSRVRAAARFARGPDRASVLTTPRELPDIISGAGLWIRPP